MPKYWYSIVSGLAGCPKHNVTFILQPLSVFQTCCINHWCWACQTFEYHRFHFHIWTFDWLLDFLNILNVLFEPIVLFGICYLVAIDDVGKEKGEEEDKDDGDKDQPNCWPLMTWWDHNICWMLTYKVSWLIQCKNDSPQVISPFTCQNTLVWPPLKYLQLSEDTL